AIKYLDNSEKDLDKTHWKASVTENHVEFSRFVRGVRECRLLNRGLLESMEFANLAKLGVELGQHFGAKSELLIKERKVKGSIPSKVLESIFEQGKRGISLQRFKGLGEMNAEQLWETTLDPSKRTLLQIKVG